MKLRWWYVIVFNFLLAALVIAGAALYVIHFKGWEKNSKTEKNVLVIRDAGSGKIYGKWTLEGSEEFAIEFIHSVNQSPVREFYRAEGRMIRPTTVRFSSFGAGMRSDLEDGQTMSREGDALVISGFNASFRELNYIVGTVSDHLLIIKDQSLSLRELCGRNAHINIYIK